MLTLEECIKNWEEFAESHEATLDDWIENSPTYQEWKKDIEDARQLVEWLRELKDLRERLEPQPCEECRFKNDKTFCEVCCHNYSSMFADKMEVKENEDNDD